MALSPDSWTQFLRGINETPVAVTTTDCVDGTGTMSESTRKTFRQSGLASVAVLLAAAGCAGTSSTVYHTVAVTQMRSNLASNVRYSYGPIKDETVGQPSPGVQISVTANLPIPEYLDVQWTTTNDGLQHSAQVPIASAVSAQDVRGNIVLIELDGPSLRVFLVQRLPNYRRRRTQIYGPPDSPSGELEGQ